MQVKHVKTDGHAGNHDQAGDQVEQAILCAPSESSGSG
jgi:hypothetical protein